MSPWKRRKRCARPTPSITTSRRAKTGTTEVPRPSARPSCTANPRPNRNEKMVMNRPPISGPKAWSTTVSSQDAFSRTACIWGAREEHAPAEPQVDVGHEDAAQREATQRVEQDEALALIDGTGVRARGWGGGAGGGHDGAHRQGPGQPRGGAAPRVDGPPYAMRRSHFWDEPARERTAVAAKPSGVSPLGGSFRRRSGATGPMVGPVGTPRGRKVPCPFLEVRP